MREAVNRQREHHTYKNAVEFQKTKIAIVQLQRVDGFDEQRKDIESEQ